MASAKCLSAKYPSCSFPESKARLHFAYKPNDAPSVWKKLCHTPRCSLILKVGKSWPQAGETVRKWRNTYYLIRHRSRFTAVPLSIAFVASIDGPIGFSAAAFLSGNPLNIRLTFYTDCHSCRLLFTWGKKDVFFASSTMLSWLGPRTNSLCFEIGDGGKLLSTIYERGTPGISSLEGT